MVDALRNPLELLASPEAVRQLEEVILEVPSNRAVLFCSVLSHGLGLACPNPPFPLRSLLLSFSEAGRAGAGRNPVAMNVRGPSLSPRLTAGGSHRTERNAVCVCCQAAYAH